MIDAGIFSTFIFMKKNFVLFGVFAALASFYGCGGDSKSSAPEEPVVDPVADRCYEKYGFEENAEWSKMISGDSYLEKIGGVVCVPQSVAYHLGGGTLPQGNPRKTFLNFRNNLLLLYKNLPEDRLKSVMRLRFWLDALASLQFLLTMQWGSFLAVWKARRAFHEMKEDFRKDRL